MKFRKIAQMGDFSVFYLHISKKSCKFAEKIDMYEIQVVGISAFYDNKHERLRAG